MEIKCALCRKWYDLTNRGPDGLANNLTLVQLLALTGHNQHYPSCFSMIPKSDIGQGKNQWAKSSGLPLNFLCLKCCNYVFCFIKKISSLIIISLNFRS